MAATGSTGNEVRQRVGRGGASFVLLRFHEVCIKWPLGCLLKPTYRESVVVLFELEVK